MIKWYHDHTGYIGRDTRAGMNVRIRLYPMYGEEHDATLDDIGVNTWRYHLTFTDPVTNDVLFTYYDWETPEGMMVYPGQTKFIKMFSTRGLRPYQSKRAIEEALDYILTTREKAEDDETE